MFYALMDRVGVPVSSIAEAEQEKESTPAGVPPRRKRRGKEGYVSYSDSEVGERIVYTGNEDGVPMDCLDDDSVPTRDESFSENGVSETDSYEDSSEYNGTEEEDYFDEEQEHIQTLVTLSGNSSKFYDTNRWVRALLWNIQMYVDGYCGDYSFRYGKPYGPPITEILNYIRNHDGDPFLHQAPVSNWRPLLPHQAAMAVLPKQAKHLLPKPLQRIYDDPVAVRKIFGSKDDVDVPSLIAETDRIPKSEFSSEELLRTFHGTPILLRHQRPQDQLPYSNPWVRRPGQKFEEIASRPVIYRAPFAVTSAPPCYKWPRGTVANLLELPYKTVGGFHLRPKKGAPLPTYSEQAARSRENVDKSRRRAHRSRRQFRHRASPRRTDGTAAE